jgi:ribosome-binding factor A
MPSKLRIRRISDRIKQEISEMLVMGQISDPRLEGLFVTDVNVDRELTFANVFVSGLEGESSSKDVLQGLEHASGFLRSTLAKRIELRTFPRLRFFWDPTPERAERMERLIDNLKEQEKINKPEDNDS